MAREVQLNWKCLFTIWWPYVSSLHNTHICIVYDNLQTQQSRSGRPSFRFLIRVH